MTSDRWGATWPESPSSKAGPFIEHMKRWPGSPIKAHHLSILPAHHIGMGPRPVWPRRASSDRRSGAALAAPRPPQRRRVPSNEGGSPGFAGFSAEEPVRLTLRREGLVRDLEPKSIKAYGPSARTTTQLLPWFREYIYPSAVVGQI